MITKNNLPIIVTILLAIAAWTFTHAVNRFIQRPMIKVSQTIKTHTNKTSKIKLNFKNITQNINFKNMKIRILGNSQTDKFTKPNLSVIGSGWSPKAMLTEERDGIKLEFDNFHPSWEVALETTMSGKGNPRIQLQKSAAAVILQESGFKTWIIEYEIVITSTLGAGAIMFIFAWMIRDRKKE